MQKNLAELQAGFAETGPNWPALAEYLGAHGVFDGDGKPPTAFAVRHAWYRTRRAAATQFPAPTESIGVTQIPAAGREGASPQNEVSAPKRAFAPAKLRNHTPGAPAPPLPAPQRPPARSQEEVQAMIDRMTSGAPKRSF